MTAARIAFVLHLATCRLLARTLGLKLTVILDGFEHAEIDAIGDEPVEIVGARSRTTRGGVKCYSAAN